MIRRNKFYSNISQKLKNATGKRKRLIFFRFFNTHQRDFCNKSFIASKNSSYIFHLSSTQLLIFYLSHQLFVNNYPFSNTLPTTNSKVQLYTPYKHSNPFDKSNSNEINKTFQEIGVNISINQRSIKLQSSAPAPTNTIAGKSFGPKAKPIVTEVPVLGFGIKSNYNPVTWLQLLTKFSSFEINNIDYNINDSSWNYEGVFYVL